MHLGIAFIPGIIILTAMTVGLGLNLLSYAAQDGKRNLPD
jgi:hypothetical protein